MTATPETDPAYEVTPARARMLADHAIHVQGGFSTPEIEAERARKDMADGGGPINWDKMEGELNAALAVKVAALGTPEPAKSKGKGKGGKGKGGKPAKVRAVDEVDEAEPADQTTVDVTPVLADVVAGEALREQIKNLTRDLKTHEDAIKDMLGDALVGVDNTGKTVVRWPVRNRTDLVKVKVREKLSDADYADCEQVTSYRSLLYGA